jgi:mTERF
MASKGSASYRWSRSNVRQLLYLFTDDLQLSSKETIKVLMGYPQLLNYHTSTLRSSATYFRDEVGLNARRMITRRPMVLTYSVEQQLRPTLEFLKKMKSSNWTGWRRMVESYPQVLQYSVETTWIPKLAFLKTFLQLERSKDAAHIVSSFPPILWLRDELLRTKLDFLETTLQLNKAELRYLVMSFPQLLGLAVDQNLRPKCQFLLETMSLEQLREFCLYQPSLLAYSLEGRLRPRIERMKDNAIYFGYSPPYLMSLSDEKFQQW